VAGDQSTLGSFNPSWEDLNKLGLVTVQGFSGNLGSSESLITSSIALSAWEIVQEFLDLNSATLVSAVGDGLLAKINDLEDFSDDFVEVSSLNVLDGRNNEGDECLDVGDAAREVFEGGEVEVSLEVDLLDGGWADLDGGQDDWEEFLAVDEELAEVSGIDVTEDWEESIDEGKDVTVAVLVVSGVFEEVPVVVGGVWLGLEAFEGVGPDAALSHGFSGLTNEWKDEWDGGGVVRGVEIVEDFLEDDDHTFVGGPAEGGVIEVGEETWVLNEWEDGSALVDGETDGGHQSSDISDNGGDVTSVDISDELVEGINDTGGAVVAGGDLVEGGLVHEVDHAEVSAVVSGDVDHGGGFGDVDHEVEDITSGDIINDLGDELSPLVDLTQASVGVVLGLEVLVSVG